MQIIKYIILNSILYLSLLVSSDKTLVNNSKTETDTSGLEIVKQILVAPPFLPKHEQKYSGKSKIIQIQMIIEEKEVEIEPGVFAQTITFNGTSPGPIIVVHEGDYVELTLKNPKNNLLLHNIDFHASTGALGGGLLSKVSPGEEVVIRFKADRPGTYFYHCAPGGLMIPYHVLLGMYGAIMILPKDGLKDNKGKIVTYDRAYYIGQQGWYIPKDKNGNYKRYKNSVEPFNDTLKIMRNLKPTHIVLNSKKDSLTGKSAMRAKVGETILFIHAQANESAFIHLIGGHADLIWPGGSFRNIPMVDREIWNINGGEVIAAMYTFKQPGIYVYLDHNLIKSFLFNAKAEVQVEGQWNNDLMQQIKKPRPITD